MFGRSHSLYFDLLSAFQPEALRPRETVDERARLDSALCRRTRPELRRKEPIEPLAERLRRNDDRGRLHRAHPAHRAATSSVRCGGRGFRSAATSAASRIATPTTMKL